MCEICDAFKGAVSGKTGLSDVMADRLKLIMEREASGSPLTAADMRGDIEAAWQHEMNKHGTSRKAQELSLLYAVNGISRMADPAASLTFRLASFAMMEVAARLKLQEEQAEAAKASAVVD